mmetsp:Transcript_46983/g.62188  ORF Transcript_46983/g.62188 Transcript_46983/m.62188 type:complete len:203 (+) Transcript_46983:433-1041(+)
MNSAQRYAKKIEKRAGNQFKIKKPEFMVYLKRHPTYTQSGGGGDNSMTGKLNRSVGAERKMSKKAIAAREVITGHSFMLETHTIDEESENSQDSPSSKKEKAKESSSSNFKSLTKYSDPLDKIDESPFEDGNFVSHRTPNPSHKHKSPIASETAKKDYDSAGNLKPHSKQIPVPKSGRGPPRPPAGRGVPRPPAARGVPPPP